MTGDARPEGISRRHIHQAGGRTLQAWAGLLLLGAIVGLSVTGLYGNESRISGSHTVATLTVDAPARIRNGELFEMRLTIDAHDTIAQPTLIIDEAIWRDITINTYLPTPAQETMRDGALEFSWDALAAGEQLVFKVDGQINPDHPPVAGAGRIRLADGERELVSLDYRLEVLP